MSAVGGGGVRGRALLDLVRAAAGLPGFLRRPLAPAAAAEAVAAAVRRREAAFVEVAAKLIFAAPGGPFARLLRWSGCELGDLRRMAGADGVEATLARLRTAGVWVSAEELRGRAPLRRSGLTLALAPRDFDNPLAGGRIGGSTSGSTGAALPVRYAWRFLAGEAADELLLLASHGCGEAPVALWLPGPPGIAGLHNLLVHAKLGRPAQRWFSPSPAPAPGSGLAFHADRGWRLLRRLLPRLGPSPEWVPPARAEEVARWLAESPRPAVLKCFASAAMRLAGAAAAAGLELSRHLVFAGGEPLTAERRDFMARCGLRVFARYAATETGFVAGACPAGASGGDMHLYADRLAVIAGERGALAFTSLSLAAPKVLFNVELGDHGLLRRQACDCALGRAGLVWRVDEVHSPAKIALDGVKLGEVDFTSLVAGVVRELGGGDDDFQIWLGASTSGAAPKVVLSPQARIEPAALRDGLRRRLPGLAGGGALAAALWCDAGALAVERLPLRLGPDAKLRRLVRLDGSDGAASAGTGDALRS
ncbi:MAG TPA: hypothetical protein VKY89_06410 [Thermoanaerobaculia bacterium]|nr:hypothetical protein [Thermoanaerobaculia bacterium]